MIVITEGQLGVASLKLAKCIYLIHNNVIINFFPSIFSFKIPMKQSNSAMKH